MFFDGASKGNPRGAGVGGTICGPSGQQETMFVWGLGIVSNKKAKAIVVYQGLIMLKEHKISTIVVDGNPSIVIQSLYLCSPPQNLSPIHLIQ